MRRNHPPVKRCRGHKEAICCHQVGIHEFTLCRSNRGSRTTPPFPFALALTRQRLFGGGTVPPSIGPAFLRSSRPARCHAPRPATRIRPCPGRWWGGRELLSLSDEGLQLVFVQVNPTLPLELLPHLRPTPPHGLQLSKNFQRFCEGHGLSCSGGRIG